MLNLDKILRCHPEHIDVIIKAFEIYATKNDMDMKEMLSDVTTIDYDLLIKKYKKYKKSTTPYANISPPGSSYSFFMKENYIKIKNIFINNDPNHKPKLGEVSKEVSKQWNNLSGKLKKKYELLSQKDKERYQNEKSNINDKLENKNINKPKRPQSAFFFYLADVRPKLKEQYPGIKTTDVAKEGRKMWQSLNANIKKKYNKISELDKKRYAKEKSIYMSKLENQ